MEDREIDILIAEKIMGWKWFDNPEKPIRYFRQKDSFLYGAITEGKLIEYTGYLPRYSTDIAAAWEVEKKIEYMPGGYYIEYISQLTDLLRIPKTGEGFSMGEVWMFIRATPLQRCLAALKTVGVEVK